MPHGAAALSGGAYGYMETRPCTAQCRCKTSCQRIAQCNMGCFAISFLLLREALHREVKTQLYFLQWIAATGRTVYHPASNFSLNIFGSFDKSTCAHFSFFVPTRSSGNENKLVQRQKYCKLLRSYSSVLHPSSTTCNAALLRLLRKLRRSRFINCVKIKQSARSKTSIFGRVSAL